MTPPAKPSDGARKASEKKSEAEEVPKKEVKEEKETRMDVDQ